MAIRTAPAPSRPAGLKARAASARPAAQPASKPAANQAIKPATKPAAPAADPAYAQGVAALKAKLAKEAELPLQKGAESILMTHPGRPAKGTIVMYHGFTAGTWQFELLAQKCYEAGYNVYIPRLPGHGFKDAKGVEDPSQLLGAGQWSGYEAFAERTYQEAKSLGGPVHVMGLSVGGNIALNVAEKHPDVADVVAYAPFLRPKGGGALFDAFHMLDKVTFGLAGKVFNMIPFHWDEQTKRDTASGKRPGHSQFDLGNIYAASEYGRKLIANSHQIKSPVQFFVTGADDAANEDAIRKAFDQSGGKDRDGWYYYPKSEGIPHPMVHPMEDKGKGQTPALYDMTLQFLESHQPIDRGL
jgi:alpha-beta hydrolase superfamily lysophospholipase